ncbi:vps9-ankyrin repeat-containing, partial [Fusarium albosuccineum]
MVMWLIVAGARDLKNVLEQLKIRAENKTRDKSDHILSKAYDEAMERIEQLSPAHRDLAHRVLSWICCARRELGTKEIQHALALRDGDAQLHRDGSPEAELLVSVCCGLVTVNEKSRTIRLVHYTAQDYFEQNRKVFFPHAHAHIAKQCINYISLSVFGHEVSPSLRHRIRLSPEYPLYEYAALNWGIHARNALPSNHVEKAALKFLSQGKMALAAAEVQPHMPPIWRRGREWSWVRPAPPSPANGLHLAAYYGLSCLLPDLTKQYGINSKSAQGLTALRFAVDGGHTATVELLLREDPDLNIQDSKGRTVLMRAAEEGSLAIVTLLMGNQPNLDLKDHGGETALLKAMKRSGAPEGDYQGIIELLFEKGADPNWKPIRERKPPTEADSEGSCKIDGDVSEDVSEDASEDVSEDASEDVS